MDDDVDGHQRLSARRSVRFPTRAVSYTDPLYKRGPTAVSAPERTIWLTNFWVAKRHGIPAVSIAFSQPKGFDYPEVPFLKPIGPRGQRLRSQFPSFKEEYEEVINRNSKEIGLWLDELRGPLAVVCYCSAKRYKLARCHRILVAKLIRRLRPDLTVVLDFRNPAWR